MTVLKNPYSSYGSYGSYSTRSSFTPTSSPPFVPNFNGLFQFVVFRWNFRLEMREMLSTWASGETIKFMASTWCTNPSFEAIFVWLRNWLFFLLFFLFLRRAKISRAVDFELEIDLKEVLCELAPEQSTRYELFGISAFRVVTLRPLHGASETSSMSGKWFLADDGSITVYENEEEWFKERVKEAAYVLFYRRIK